MNQSFCPLPFIEYCNTTGNMLKLCCESENIGPKEHESIMEDFEKHSVLNEVRRKMLAGERVKFCSNCYDWEDTGGDSPRLDRLRETDPKLLQKALEGEIELASLDLKFGNVCNLACTMCEPTNSSLISDHVKKDPGKDLRKFDTIDSIPSYHKFEMSALDELDFSKITRVKSTGGEPMLQEGFYEFVDRLDEQCSLRIVTNGTIDLVPYWNMFASKKYVSINFSAEGINETYNHNRWPSKFSKFERNIRKILEKQNKEKLKHIRFCISSAVGVLTFHETHKLMQWIIDLNKEFSFDHDPILELDLDIVRDPLHSQPALAPEDFIQKAIEEMQNLIAGREDIFHNADDFTKVLKNQSDNIDPREKKKGLRQLKSACAWWSRNRNLDYFSLPIVQKTLDQLEER